MNKLTITLNGRTVCLALTCEEAHLPWDDVALRFFFPAYSYLMAANGIAEHGAMKRAVY